MAINKRDGQARGLPDMDYLSIHKDFMGGSSVQTISKRYNIKKSRAGRIIQDMSSRNERGHQDKGLILKLSKDILSTTTLLRTLNVMEVVLDLDIDSKKELLKNLSKAGSHMHKIRKFIRISELDTKPTNRSQK